MPQKAALAGLDTLEANHYTQAKSAVLRGIAALTALEPLLAEIQSGEPIVFKEGLTKLIQQVKKLGKKRIKRDREGNSFNFKTGRGIGRSSGADCL